MVRDNQKCAAVTQSASLEDAKQGQSTEGVCTESQEPEEQSLELLLSNKIDLEDDETWSLVSAHCWSFDGWLSQLNRIPHRIQ